MLKSITLLVALAGLAACGSSSSGGMAFSQPDIGTPSFTAAAGQLAIANGGGISFFNRIDPKEGSKFGAEYYAGAVLAPAPTSGSARMTGPFALRQLTGLRVSKDNRYSGKLSDRTGSIILNADFGSGTLRGEGDGLTVDGRIVSGGLEGSATYGGVTSNLDGLIGASNAIGTFEGQNGNSTIAGGFVVAQ